MTKIQAVEHEVKKLDRISLAAFRNWFLKFDSDAWDRQIEADVRAGKLNKLTQAALREHRAGKTRPI